MQIGILSCQVGSLGCSLRSEWFEVIAISDGSRGLFFKAVISNIPCGTWRADPSYLTPKIIQMGPKNSDKET